MSREITQEKGIAAVVKLLKGAKRLFFITGAGISADSGLPTYRGIGGLYNNTETDEGIPIEMALAGEMLEKRPEVTWKYLSQIERNCRGAKFNRAHKVISEMENRFDRVLVLTQNIDGFHRAAGSKNVIEIHGDLHELYCAKCRWRERVEDYNNLELPPHCPKCSALLRPDVVFFGEMLDTKKVDNLISQLGEGFDMYFSVGTTSIFPYIQQPILTAKKQGLPTIEINPADTEVSQLVDIKIRLGAAEALDNIWSMFNLK